MDTTVQLIFKNVVASLIRAALVAGGTYLVTKNVLPSFLNDALQPHVDEMATGIIIILSSVGWSIWQKVHVNRKVDAALNAPEGTPRAIFEAELKSK